MKRLTAAWPTLPPSPPSRRCWVSSLIYLLGLFWTVYLLVVASVEVHAIAAKTAWIVFGALAALLALVQINVHRSARQMGESGEVMQRDMAQQMDQIQKQLEEEMKKHPPQPEQQ